MIGSPSDAPPDRFSVRVAERPRDFGRTLDLLAELLVSLALRELRPGDRPPDTPLALCC